MMHYYESWAAHMGELLIPITSCIKSYINLIQRFFLMEVPMNEESIRNTVDAGTSTVIAMLDVISLA